MNCLPMKAREFESKDMGDQIAIIYSSGVFIGKRKKNNIWLFLYQVDALYLEISYISYRNDILSIRCDESIDILEDYLEQVALPEIEELQIVL